MIMHSRDFSLTTPRKEDELGLFLAPPNRRLARNGNPQRKFLFPPLPRSPDPDAHAVNAPLRHGLGFPNLYPFEGKPFFSLRSARFLRPLRPCGHSCYQLF